jgi:hypothetical protein
MWRGCWPFLFNWVEQMTVEKLGLGWDGLLESCCVLDAWILVSELSDWGSNLDFELLVDINSVKRKQPTRGENLWFIEKRTSCI